MRILTCAAGVATLGFALQANAALMLDSTVTASFLPGYSGMGPGNDLPNEPPAIRFGQLQASVDGTVQFYFTGSEAGYANTMRIGGASYPTVHNFTPPDALLGALNVAAGSYLDYGFCTSGGASVGAFGMCVSNNNAASLIAQFNYMEAPGSEAGYRSIGYRPLTSYNATTGLAAASYGLATVTDSSLWGIFWDDSGALNDDDYDDFIAVASFTPTPSSVPEPLSLLLLGSGLLGIGVMRRGAAKS